MHSWAKLHSKGGMKQFLVFLGIKWDNIDKQTIDGHLKHDAKVRIFHQTPKKSITPDSVKQCSQRPMDMRHAVQKYSESLSAKQGPDWTRQGKWPFNQHHFTWQLRIGGNRWHHHRG